MNTNHFCNFNAVRKNRSMLLTAVQYELANKLSFWVNYYASMIHAGEEDGK